MSRRLVSILLVICLLIVTYGALVLNGLFDPRPVGPLVQTIPAQRLVVESAWLEQVATVDRPFSLRGSVAVLDSAETEVGYRITATDGWLEIVVTPTGTVAIRQQHNGRMHNLLPAQPWPHLQLGTLPNELWLDITADETRVWVNGELLWRQDDLMLSCAPCAVYRRVEANAEVGVIQFDALSLYQPE